GRRRGRRLVRRGAGRFPVAGGQQRHVQQQHGERLGGGHGGDSRCGCGGSRNGSSSAPSASTATPTSAPSPVWARLAYSRKALVAQNSSGTSGYSGTRNGRG